MPSRGLHSTAERHRRPPDQQTISVLLNDIGRVAVVQFSLRPKGPWVADNLDQRIARLPAIACGFVVRWTVPEMRSMAQFLDPVVSRRPTSPLSDHSEPPAFVSRSPAVNRPSPARKVPDDRTGSDSGMAMMSR